MPRAGASYALRSAQGALGDTRLLASYGQGIVEPRFDQSYGTDPCFPGNPNLLPDQSRTIHAGFEQKLASDRVRLTADYFDSRFRNIISFLNVQPTGACLLAGAPDGAGTFFNTDLAVARGFSVYSRITNLANKQYQEVYGYPALGREFRIGLKYTTRHE